MKCFQDGETPDSLDSPPQCCQQVCPYRSHVPQVDRSLPGHARPGLGSLLIALLICPRAKAL